MAACKLLGESWNAIRVPLGGAEHDRDILPIDIAPFTERPLEGLPGRRCARCSDEDSDARHLARRLLRVSGERCDEDESKGGCERSAYEGHAVTSGDREPTRGVMRYNSHS